MPGISAARSDRLQVLNGNPPFKDYGNEALLRAVLIDRQRPTPEPQQRNGVSYRTLWKVAKSCWNHSPSKRPTIETVFQHLGGHLSEIESLHITAVRSRAGALTTLRSYQSFE